MKTKIVTFLLVTVTSLSLFYVMEKVRFDKNKQKIEIVESVRILPTFGKKSSFAQKDNRMMNTDKTFESELGEISQEGYSLYNQRKPSIQRDNNTFINVYSGENNGLNKKIPLFLLLKAQVVLHH